MSSTAETARGQLVRTIAEQHALEPGALLPVLHEVMDELGHLTRDDLEAVAGSLNLSVAEVHGVVSFYKDFRTTPPADHTIALCRAEACQAVGGQSLFEETAARAESLGPTSAVVEVEEVFCFGNCALGPAGMVDGRLYGRLTSRRIDELTQEWRR